VRGVATYSSAALSYLFDQADKARAYMQTQFDRHGCKSEDATHAAVRIVREPAVARILSVSKKTPRISSRCGFRFVQPNAAHQLVADVFRPMGNEMYLSLRPSRSWNSEVDFA
jgi:hypothetical protein